MIIGVCGLIGSGKGTVADILVETHGFTKLSFADSLKDGVATIFNWDRKLLEGDTKESREWREAIDPYWTKEVGFEVTPRLVLQLFGTECMRQGFHDNVWVSIVKQRILNNPEKNYVIPDTRFKNEIEMIRTIGGWVWEIKRNPLPKWFSKYRSDGISPVDIHRSEWDWALSHMDVVIENDSDINWLKKMVDTYINIMYDTKSK